MINFNDILPKNQYSSIALGFFDGVHKGHRNVLSLTAKEKAKGLIPLCFTFSENPKAVISEKHIPYLQLEADKAEAMKSLGIEHIIEADFDKIKDMSAKDFFEKILVNQLRAKKIFCGFNYHFGKNGEGNTELLKKMCEDFSVFLTVIPPEKLDGEVISSTVIRNLISNGEIKKANRMLCSRFCFTSQIMEGQKLGRTLGIPTINQPLGNGLVVPKFGVYATKVTLEDKKEYCGVTNIGIKPTVGGTKPLSETWIQDYDGEEIYGQSAKISFIDFIRPEKKFDSLRELKAEILKNSKTALQIYNSENQAS